MYSLLLRDFDSSAGSCDDFSNVRVKLRERGRDAMSLSSAAGMYVAMKNTEMLSMSLRS
jgi:hypothetical protein